MPAALAGTISEPHSWNAGTRCTATQLPAGPYPGPPTLRKRFLYCTYQGTTGDAYKRPRNKDEEVILGGRTIILPIY